MSEPLQVTQEQLQAILDALNTACVSTYHGYQFTDSDVQSVNQQLQSSGIEVDLNIVRVDFADALGGAGGLQTAFQGIEHAIEQGFAGVIKHAFDTSYYPGGSPSGMAKIEEVTTALNDIKMALQMAQAPIVQADLSQIEMKLGTLTASIDSLTEAAILGTRGEPIPKDKAQRAAKKVYDALQAKPEVYDALVSLLSAEWSQEAEQALQAHHAKVSPLTNMVHDSVVMTAPAPKDAEDENKLLQTLWDNTAMPPK